MSALFLLVVRRMFREPLFPLLTALQAAMASAGICLALAVDQGLSIRQLSHAFAIVAGHQSPEGISAQFGLFRPSDLPRLRAEFPAPAWIATYLPLGNLRLSVGQNSYTLDAAAETSEEFDRAVNLRLMEGTFFNAEDLRRRGTALISTALAKRLFGSESAVGRSLTVGSELGGRGERILRIQGVFWNEPGSPQALPHLLLPPGFSDGIAIAPLLLVRPNSRLSDLASALEAVRQFYRDDPTFKLNGGALYVSRSLDPEAALERPGRTVEVVVLLTSSAILAALGLVAVLGSLLRLLQTRRYSIALERSLGAQRTFVLAEVLLEGMLLVMPGVLLGIAAFGLYSGPLTGGAVLFDQQLTLSGHLSAIIALTAFVLTLAISIYPAVAATSIKPALLLRGD